MVHDGILIIPNPLYNPTNRGFAHCSNEDHKNTKKQIAWSAEAGVLFHEASYAEKEKDQSFT